ncbi:MAG: pyridoxamine 5'-phosphate oxidase [Sphingomonadaceae bacterium]
MSSNHFSLADSHSVIPDTDPFTLFDAWMAEAVEAEPNDPNAMALATATPEGRPSLRMVLLKGHGTDGFVFYTNSHSRKGRDIAANPQAALLFHWKSLRRQIRIEGRLEEVSDQMVDDYFHSRPRVSQIGSAASDQSSPLADRATYLERVEKLEGDFPDGVQIPRPPQWKGYRLIPDAIEFWVSRDFRLHDRRRFSRLPDGQSWSSSLLYP